MGHVPTPPQTLADGAETMIVCICNAVTEREIDDAVAEGAHSLEALQRILPVANQCGTCRCCAEACVEASVDRRLRTRKMAQAPTIQSPLVPATI